MNKIKELRAEIGLTQSKLAKLLGVNQTAIGKYERGDLEPNIENLIKLSNIFEVSVDYLIGSVDDFGNITINSNNTLSLEEDTILRSFRTIPKDLQQRVKVYLEKLVEVYQEENNINKK